MRSVSDNAEAATGASAAKDPVVIVTDGDTVSEPTGWAAGLRRSPLLRRVTGYSAGSVIAAFTSELAFAGVYGWLHAGTTWSSLAGFIGGAIPNYILNRRWAWQDRKGRSRRQEITLYAAVSIASFLVSILVTNAAEHWARHLTSAHNLRVLLVAAAYLAVSGVFFVGKFVAYELIVFTKGPATAAATGEALVTNEGSVTNDGSVVGEGLVAGNGMAGGGGADAGAVTEGAVTEGAVTKGSVTKGLGEPGDSASPPDAASTTS